MALANSDFNLKTQHDFRQIEVIRNFAPDTPEISCDGSQIQQVLLNILKNGAQAMWEAADQGRAPQFVIDIYTEQEYVRIDIADNGLGMPAEVQKKIFEPFYTTKPTGSGTGLGLSIAYFIVTEKHGGILSAASTPDQGTTVTVKLPLHQTP